jgi:hypothetical protein
MSSPQTHSTTSWPFAFVNGERTKESQQLLDSKHSKHYNTKEVLDTNDYEESPF